MLSQGDEWPLHQTPEPIAFSGSDRNFYDRYFFNGYLSDGDGFFAIAFGVYPHLNVVDAHLSVLRDGRQHSLHASALLGMERMALTCGPFGIEVIEPLNSLRIVIAETDGLAADVTFTGRGFPILEPRFTRRTGPRMLMDVTRFTQNGRWSGAITVDGKAVCYDHGRSLGTRDRSWGVRPIGAADPQPTPPLALPQFYWLWAPTNFPNLSMFFHVNEDQSGGAWNTRAALVMEGGGRDGEIHLNAPRARPWWKPGTRRAAGLELRVEDGPGRPHAVRWTPIATFLMRGIGYGHPEWAHGSWKGELVTQREVLDPEADPMLPHNLHIQSIAKARHEGPDGLAADGIGIVEQLVIGPHAPSGFVDTLDPA
jgi:hypothetical protein